jgi:hypothetical protein
MRCLAQLSASSTRLCARHGLLVKLGIAVYDYSTGRQIYAD